MQAFAPPPFAEGAPLPIVGILGGMDEEINEIVAAMEDVQPKTVGMRTYYQGLFNGRKTVVVASRWGKVAGASAAVQLIVGFGVTELLVIGLCGAISNQAELGDVIIGDRHYQHDLDATPVMARFEIPQLGITYIAAEAARVAAAKAAIGRLFGNGGPMPGIAPDMLEYFRIAQPQVRVGSIASGDKFFADPHEKHAMQAVLPDVLCVEMEGAAVAQVCYEYGVPFTVIRVVSDASDEESESVFVAFAAKVAGIYCRQIAGSLVG